MIDLTREQIIDIRKAAAISENTGYRIWAARVEPEAVIALCDLALEALDARESRALFKERGRG